MIIRARVLLAAVAAVLVVAVSSGPVAAQELPPDTPPTTAPAIDDAASEPVIEIVSASPWAAPDGEWVAHLRFAGAPEGARLNYTIAQPISGSEAEIRSSLSDARDATFESKVLQSPVSVPVADITDASGISELRVPIRSRRTNDDERAFLPNAGVHPVMVKLQTSGRTTLASTTLYLNRLPTAESRPADPMRLALLVQQRPALAFDDRGDPDVSDEMRMSIDKTVTTLTAAGDLSVTTAIDPQSLVALTSSQIPTDPVLVERLSRNLESASLLRAPWAELHVDGWAASGTLADVQTALVDGQEATFARLAVPIDNTTWPPDPTVGSEGIALLGRVGVDNLIVEPSQLLADEPPEGESGYSRPVRLEGTNGSTLAGFSFDPDLTALIDSPSTQPVLAVHQIMALLFGTWLADDSERGSILRLGDDADEAVVAELLGVLQSAPFTDRDSTAITVVTATELISSLDVITMRQSGRDVPWTRVLAPPSNVPNVGVLSAALRQTRPLLADYSAMLPDNDPGVARVAIVVQRSLDRRLAPDEEAAVLAAARAVMAAALDSITASESRSLTITSRRTSIPLTFTNALDQPLQVRLRLQSPRLNFLDGEEQMLTLRPGLNRVDVAVEVRASGQFMMKADLLAPESDRVLASTRQRIRSTTFSGVGLMLSGGALLFLVIWWSRTLRRGRVLPENAGSDQ